MSTTGLAETALPPDIFRGLQPIRSDAERATAAWNAAMANQAVALEAQGVSPRDIFLQTRTWRGQDGKLRQEAFPALPERRASTMPGFGQPSVPGEFLGGFVGGPQRFSVMDPEAQRLQAARDVGQQASVAAELYGAASPFAIASTMARRGQMMGVSPLDVFHGSPHRFTKFDSSKIGTGEGAQAYGYGLYFAENPNVAKGYRNVLADTLEINGYATELEKRAGQMALTFGDNTKEGAIRWLSKFEGKGASHTTPALTAELINSVKAKFESGVFNKGGSLYTIDLPDQMIDRMLDWDKPLSQQSRAVRKAIKADRPGLFMEGRYSDILTAGSTLAARGITGPYAVAGHNPAYRYGVAADAMTGQDYWHLIMRDRQANPADASEAMRQAGIPGIKYLDRGSRGAGTGTRNFVVFPGEEEALTILSRD